MVTLAVGRRIAARWHSVCEPRWRRYCERHGYDLICIEEPLDTTARARGRSPAWQKCLILGQPFAERYEQIVWVDADLLPNPEAPPVADPVPVDRVGAVDEYSMPTREVHNRTLAKLYRHWDAQGIAYVDNLTTAEYYRNFGLPAEFDAVVQTGMMVLSPAHHRELLEDVYARYEDAGPGLNYEMRPLSFELLRAGVVTWLDPRFNYIWGHYKALHFPFLVTSPEHPRAAECAARALADVHFLHFAGATGEMAAAAAASASPAAKDARPVRTRRPSGLRTPVVLLVHSRPEPTRTLARIVRAARPSKVLVVADGPSGPGDGERCAETRRAIAEADFPCEVLTNYADRNLGLKRRVESGLDWAFSLVDEAIVLEDDCHPHQTFFRFCGELLARYRDEPRVTTISGSNFGQGASADASYFFSRYPVIWGWATWARAWRHYSRDLADWPERRASGWLDELFEDPQAVQYWTYIFGERRVRQDTWDAGWLYGSWVSGGLAAVSRRNLVTNVGFGDDATHTKVDHTGLFANIPAVDAELPLRHPPRIERDAEADAFLEDVMFSGNLRRLFNRIRTLRPQAPAR